jgi:hypothetical protein
MVCLVFCETTIKEIPTRQQADRGSGISPSAALRVGADSYEQAHRKLF